MTVQDVGSVNNGWLGASFHFKAVPAKRNSCLSDEPERRRRCRPGLCGLKIDHMVLNRNLSSEFLSPDHMPCFLQHALNNQQVAVHQIGLNIECIRIISDFAAASPLLLVKKPFKSYQIDKPIKPFITVAYILNPHAHVCYPSAKNREPYR